MEGLDVPNRQRIDVGHRVRHTTVCSLHRPQDAQHAHPVADGVMHAEQQAITTRSAGEDDADTGRPVEGDAPVHEHRSLGRDVGGAVAVDDAQGVQVRRGRDLPPVAIGDRPARREPRTGHRMHPQRARDCGTQPVLLQPTAKPDLDVRGARLTLPVETKERLLDHRERNPHDVHRESMQPQRPPGSSRYVVSQADSEPSSPQFSARQRTT